MFTPWPWQVRFTVLPGAAGFGVAFTSARNPKGLVEPGIVTVNGVYVTADPSDTPHSTTMSVFDDGVGAVKLELPVVVVAELRLIEVPPELATRHEYV